MTIAILLGIVLRFHRAAGLALLLVVGACTGSCTTSGSSCTTDDGCPLGMFCDAGRCAEPPPEDLRSEEDDLGFRTNRRRQVPPPIS